MDGQVLGGGVVVLVAVALWLVYLLPSWYGRQQFDAAERNAVRLNRALRVLAETSETPAEVRLELNARTALAQQKLARRALAEREQASLEVARAELTVAREQAKADAERAKSDAESARERMRAEAALAKVDAVAQREQARADAAARHERAIVESATARALPAARRARARRRARLLTTVIAVAAIGASIWGVFPLLSTGSPVLLSTGLGVAMASILLLARMARVSSRTVARVVATPRARVDAEMQDVVLASAERAWTPRELPRPLTASAGSRAAAELDAAAARDALRHAAQEEAMRERAAHLAPPSIDTARAARTANEPAYARMGFVDDAEIEAHVRDLLTRRASGQ